MAGRVGATTRTVSVANVYSLATEMTVWVELKSQVYEAWQMRAWSALRDAARTRYEANRALIKERLAKLQEELGGQDPLSLRKDRARRSDEGRAALAFRSFVRLRSAGTGARSCTTSTRW